MARTLLFAAVFLGPFFGCGAVRQTTQYAAAMPDDDKPGVARVGPGKPDDAKKEEENKDDDKKEKKDEGPPKTLFEWKIGHEDPNKSDEPEPDKIKTDRPDFTESSTTVGLGRVQVEMGYTYTQDRTDGGLFRTHTYPEMLVRLGLFEEWFELRIGQTVQTNQDRPAGGVTATRTGFPDLNILGVFALTEQKGILPEVAFLIGASVPSGTTDFTDKKILPVASYQYGWDVTKKWSIGGSSVISKAVEDDGHNFYVLAESLTTGYEWTDKFGTYSEVFALLPANANGPDAKPQYYFNGGVTYLVTPLFQLDVRAGVGLSRASADYFAGAGFAVKY